MIEAVRNAVTLLEIPLADALIMASRTPAVFLGLQLSLDDRAGIPRRPCRLQPEL